MTRRLFQKVCRTSRVLGMGGDVLQKHEGPLCRFLLSLSLVFCLTLPGQVEGSAGNQWIKSHMWEGWQDIRHTNSPLVNRVEHDPRGPTLSHDYWDKDPKVQRLVRLVVKAHLNNILPNIKKAYKNPGYRKQHLQGALDEVKYILGRLVNHPKALALSAIVGKLMERPRLPVAFYERALSMYPKRAMTQAQFGNFLVGVGDVEDGIKRLNVAIKINPKLGVAYAWLAWAYEKKGEPDLVKEYVQKAKEKGFRGKLP